MQRLTKLLDTCSSGAVGSLGIGLGIADVVIPLITGETWFKVPECINIIFTGDLLAGIGGKDVILHILKELKRNTVAAGRIVEFTGSGLRHLSIDARFAICNMCTVNIADRRLFFATDQSSGAWRDYWNLRT